MASKFHEETDINEGDLVTRIFAWRDDEKPTEANYHTGKVLRRIQKDLGKCVIWLYEIEGLQGLSYSDQIRRAA